ncbi:MAG TPA: MFS transporter [Gaiellaceae bacterium]|nr:MFS transporter [Gaiellaceae bacterium]
MRGGRLGALVERNFRLVWTSTTVSAFGDGVASIALVFAILAISHNSATDVGIVLACRQVAMAAVALAAGVLADRLPRHVVLVAVAAAQTVTQTIAGTLVVTHHATVWALAVLAAAYGLADGFVLPASQGLIPAVVSAGRLQQANALLGLSRSILGFAGPAIGGVLTGLGSPGAAILVDAATFAVAAVMLVRVRVAPRDDAVVPERFLHELRQGWQEFRRQTWIWTTIVFFGIGNFAGASLGVLGPLVAKRELGGATAWGLVVAADGAGAVVGGVAALRLRVPRPLAASCIAAVPYGLQMLGLGLGLPLWALVALATFVGASLAVHLALWFTVFQSQVPEAARSRVSSYDALGSFVLIPIGAAIAGPIAAALGLHATLVGAACISMGCSLVILLNRSVWAIGSVGAEPVRT